MKKLSKFSLAFKLILGIFFLQLLDGVLFSSASASPGDQIIFNQTMDSGYTHAGTTTPLYHFQLWHHSGGFWSNQTEGINISDEQMEVLMTGQLSHPTLDDWKFNKQISLPDQVQTFLSQGGSLSEVKFKFSSDRGLDPLEILKSTSNYTLTNMNLSIQAFPNFFVNRDPFYYNPNVNVTVAQPRTNYGLVAFSIFTRAGQHIGTAYSGGSNAIDASDIINSEGHLTSGKNFDVTLPGGSIVTRDGSEIKIGHNTFAGGGAVGLHFYFPITVDFYIPSNLDSIKVHFVDEMGSNIAASEEKYPTNIGPYTVVAKNISNYTLQIPAGGEHTVQINRNMEVHEIVFIYKKTQDTGIPEPPVINITGGVEVLPPIIAFRDSFQIKPVNINTGICSYASHRFRIERDGGSWISSAITSKSSGLSFSYSTYPWIIAVGYHTVSIQVATTDCGATDWIGNRTLTVNGPNENESPDFRVGWTQPGVWKDPLSQVVQGQTLDLVYLDEPAPSDPDGDSVYWLGFDFSSANTDWLKNIPTNYNETGNGYHQIQMNDLGYQRINATMRDEFGATETRTAYIEVIPPNPIALPTCPKEVKSRRIVPSNAFHANSSYSPLGRSIDYTRDEWTNKKEMYINDTLLDTTEKVYLHVYDSKGLKSLQPGECVITIKPDLPPIAKLDVPPLAIRGETYDLFNKSYSDDDDRIQSVLYKYKYDENNNGFEDEEWTPLLGLFNKAAFTPDKVGKYLFYLHAKEDYGRTDDTLDEPESTMIMDVVNLAPEVSFELEGKDQQPDFTLPTYFNADHILNEWDLYEIDSGKKIAYKGNHWSNQQGALVGGAGQLFQKQSFLYHRETHFGTEYYNSWTLPFPDNGYGANRLSPWRAATNYSTAYSFPVIVTEQAKSTVQYHPRNFSPVIRANQTYLYFSSYVYGGSYGKEGQEIHAMNKSKIGEFGSYGGFYTWDFEYKDGTPIDFTIRKEDLSRTFQGINVACRTCSPTHFDTPGQPQIKAYEISDRTIYALVEWTYNYSKGYNSSGRYYSYNKSIYDVVSFDAFTGEQLGSMLDQGFEELLEWTTSYNSPYSLSHTYKGFMDFRAFSKNDNLRLFVTKGADHDRVIEIDRYGHVVEDKNIAISLPAPIQNTDMTCSKILTYPMFKGIKGEIYKYVAHACGVNGVTQHQNASVVKINPDLTLGWITDLSGDEPFYDSCNRGFQLSNDENTVLIINPLKNEVLARSYTYPGWFYCDHYIESINMDTGAKNVVSSPNNMNSVYANFHIDWSGSYILSPYAGYQSAHATTTIEGFKTMMMHPSYGNSAVDPVFNRSGTYAGRIGAGGTVGFAQSTSSQKFGEYFGDGLYVSLHNIVSWGYDQGSTLALWVAKGTPTTAPSLFKPFQLGQFVSKETISNHELNFTFRMEDKAYDSEKAGFSFRMTNTKNRYTLETDGHVLVLKKVVNGVSTVLASTNYPFQDKTDYTFKMKMVGNNMMVYLNQVPYFNVTDDTFTIGKFGPYSDKAFVTFNNISMNEVQDANPLWSDNYAIWEPETEEAALQYNNITYKDPEDDPKAGTYEWGYLHTPRFMNNQGVSMLNGKIFTSERPTFDKVGDYTVKMKAKDDPHPDFLYPSLVFNSYREPSNEFKRNIIVHRRPIARFNLSINEDQTVSWNDTSYDPDRWISAASYSIEDTGINYGTTRGIVEKKYLFKTPSGELKEQQLIRLSEPGTYYVYLFVKDEYGAWSHAAERSLLSKCTTDCLTNTLPTAGFTLSHVTTYPGVEVRINSIAYDLEDGNRTELDHAYYIKNLTTGEAAALESTNRTTWYKTFSKIGTYEISQVVTDSANESSTFIRRIKIENQPPKANFDWSPKVVWERDEVRLINHSSDADGDKLSYIWTIMKPDKSVITINQFEVTYIFEQKGDYVIDLTVSDGMHADNIQHVITANELVLLAEVNHTPSWLEHHRQNNHNTTVHPKAFYSGETLMLRAISSTAPVSKVMAWIQATGQDGNEIYVETALTANQQSNEFSGELYDAVLSSLGQGLPKGKEEVHFKILYSNGIVKETTVSIQIIGSVMETVRVRRRH